MRSPQISDLVESLRGQGAAISLEEEPLTTDGVLVAGLNMATVGELAHQHGVILHELSEVTDSLEDAFLAVTKDDQEYRSGPSS